MPSLIDPGQENAYLVNQSHPLLKGAHSWWLALPRYVGGAKLADSLGRNPLTQSATWRGGQGRKGGRGSLSFDGTSNYAQTSSALNLTSVTKLTVSWWMYWNAFANDDDLAWESSANFNSNAGAILCDPNESGSGTWNILMRDTELSGVRGVSFTRPSGAVWHHYVVSMDIGAWTSPITAVYIDGVSQSLSPSGSGATAPSSFGNYVWYFMSRGAASLFGAGRLDDVLIVKNRLWTPAEVRQWFNLSCSGYPGLLDRPVTMSHIPVAGGPAIAPGTTILRGNRRRGRHPAVSSPGSYF